MDTDYQYSDEDCNETQILETNVSDFMKNYYSYQALYSLNHDINDFTNENILGKVYLIPYMINTSSQYPFLQFVLHKKMNLKDNGEINCKFHEFPYIKGVDILAMCNKILNLVFINLTGGKHKVFDYSGYLNNYNNMYIFFDCSDLNKDSTVTNRNNVWLALSSEIMNNERIYDSLIDGSVYRFFKDNSDFLYLKDMYNKDYELPVVGYSSSTKVDSEFMSVFGLYKNYKNRFVGNYYYFTNYENALLNAVIQKSERNEYKNRTMNSGMNRFAIFRGKTTNDINIPDENGKWADDYDSVYIKKLEPEIVMNDELCGEYVLDSNILVVKNYEQQTPISYYIF